MLLFLLLLLACVSLKIIVNTLTLSLVLCVPLVLLCLLFSRLIIYSIAFDPCPNKRLRALGNTLGVWLGFGGCVRACMRVCLWVSFHCVVIIIIYMFCLNKVCILWPNTSVSINRSMPMVFRRNWNPWTHTHTNNHFHHHCPRGPRWRRVRIDSA